MSDQFTFHGQTSFINRPTGTVIQEFHNAYVTDARDDRQQVLVQLERLVTLALESRDLPDADKEDAAQAISATAEQIKSGSGTKLGLKGTLQAIQGLLVAAADIAGPAKEIVSSALRLIGLV